MAVGRGILHRVIRVPEPVAQLKSFPELLSWAMALWGDTDGLLEAVNLRVMGTATTKTFRVSERRTSGIPVGTIDFGPHPHHGHAQWFLRLGTAVRKGYVDRLDQIGYKTPGFKNAGSATRWYTGEGAGRQSSFTDFCSAVGIPLEVERYLLVRFSRFDKLYDPTRFSSIPFDVDRVSAAIRASAPLLLRAHPWVDRLAVHRGEGPSPAVTSVAYVAPVVSPGPGLTGGPELSRDELAALGLPDRVGVDAHELGAEAVAGSIVLDAAIRDYDGVDFSSVNVVDAGDLEDDDRHPAYVMSDRKGSQPPEPNKPKAFLVDWQAPIIDQGDIMTLHLARSDYWTSQAVARVTPQIQQEVLEGERDLLELPRRLDVHLVVVCEGDDTVVLARRGRHLATEPSTWMVTVGESMDWERDCDVDGVPDPEITARRCLTERDELNLPVGIAESARLRLVALATEWDVMLANLVVVARLPHLRWTDLTSYFRRGENARLDAIPFEPNACGELLRAPLFAGTNGRGGALPVSDISKVALIAALRSTYPRAQVAAMARPASG